PSTTSASRSPSCSSIASTCSAERMNSGAFKLQFFLLYAIIGAYLPYVPVFLRHDLAMPDHQIGWVTGCYGLAVVVAPPIVAALADRRVPGRTLLAIGYAL